MKLIPGGQFLMGNEEAYGFLADGEGPEHQVTIAPYQMDECAVSNDEFNAFINATGYKTESFARSRDCLGVVIG